MPWSWQIGSPWRSQCLADHSIGGVSWDHIRCGEVCLVGTQSHLSFSSHQWSGRVSYLLSVFAPLLPYVNTGLRVLLCFLQNTPLTRALCFSITFGRSKVASVYCRRTLVSGACNWSTRSVCVDRHWLWIGGVGGAGHCAKYILEKAFEVRSPPGAESGLSWDPFNHSMNGLLRSCSKSMGRLAVTTQPNTQSQFDDVMIQYRITVSEHSVGAVPSYQNISCLS